MSAFIPIEFQKAFDKTQQPAIRITTEYTAKPDLLASRFGGVAYWQSGHDTPTDEHGKPMALLVQINFAEVPKHPDLPSSGILQCFIPRHDDYYGADLDNLGSAGKMLTQFWQNPDITQAIDWQHHDDEDDLIPVFGAHQLRFTESADIANIDVIECAEALKANPFEVLEDVALNEKEETAFYDAITQFADAQGHKLLGYPHVIQGDPREDSAYRLFLQIDTDMKDDNDIMWGNDGVGHLFIKPEDLATQRFDKLWFSWDCYED